MSIKILKKLSVGLLSITSVAVPALFITSCGTSVTGNFITPTEEELCKTSEMGVAEYTLRLKEKKTSGWIDVNFVVETDNIIAMLPTNTSPIIDPNNPSLLSFKVCFDFLQDISKDNALTIDVDFSCTFTSYDENGSKEWQQTLEDFTCVWDKKPWPRAAKIWGQDIVFGGEGFSNGIAYNRSESWRDADWQVTDLQGGDVSSFARINQVWWGGCNGSLNPRTPVGMQMKVCADVHDVDWHLERVFTVGLKGPSRFHRLASALSETQSGVECWKAEFSGFVGHIENLGDLDITLTGEGLPQGIAAQLIPEDEDNYKLSVSVPKSSIPDEKDFWFYVSIKKGDVELLASPNPYRFSFVCETTETDDTAHNLILSQPTLWSKDDAEWYRQIVSNIIEIDPLINKETLTVGDTQVTNLDFGETFTTKDSKYDPETGKFSWDTSDFYSNMGAKDYKCNFKIETIIKYKLQGSETEHYKKFTLNYAPVYDDLQTADGKIYLDVHHNFAGECTISGKTQLIVDNNEIWHTDSTTVSNIYMYTDDESMEYAEIYANIYCDPVNNKWYFDVYREFVVEEIDETKNYFMDVDCEGGSWLVTLYRQPIQFHFVN